MNEQTSLSEADALRVQVLDLRAQLIEKDRVILAQERRLLDGYLRATYGNPGENVVVAPDYTIRRVPHEAPVPAPEPALR